MLALKSQNRSMRFIKSHTEICHSPKPAAGQKQLSSPTHIGPALGSEAVVSKQLLAMCRPCVAIMGRTAIHTNGAPRATGQWALSSRLEMDTPGGASGCVSCGPNQRASAISVVSGVISPPAYSAVKAIINE